MRNQLQKAINKVVQWANECGLSLSSQKTHAVLFTHKRKIPDIDISLKIGDPVIEYTDTAKCLGVTFDSKLSWTHHINIKIKNLVELAPTVIPCLRKGGNLGSTQ